MKKTAQSYVERDKCPLYTAIHTIEGRWKPMIFQRLDRGALGFGELRRSMAGVTTKVLRQQLRQLEADDLVAICRPDDDRGSDQMFAGSSGRASSSRAA